MKQAKFNIGQIVHHRRFDYRGVIFDVDPVYSGTPEWYESMAQSRPPKHEPWYRVLVDKATHETYVAEQNLESTDNLAPIQHPAVQDYFAQLSDGRYRIKYSNN